MSFKEYLKENESVIKLKQLTDKLNMEKYRFKEAKKTSITKQPQSSEYWANAIINTQKEIAKIKTAMTKPKTVDSKKASEGISFSDKDKRNVVIDNNVEREFKTKKEAIHYLLDKGLSGAEIARKGFSSLTVQNAKKDWQAKVVTTKTKDFEKEEDNKFDSDKSALKISEYGTVDIEHLASDLNDLLKSAKPETKRLFKSFKPTNGGISFGEYPSSAGINATKNGIKIYYNSNSTSTAAGNMKVIIPLKVDENLKSSEILRKIKNQLDSFAVVVDKQIKDYAKGYSEYLKRTGDYYG